MKHNGEKPFICSYKNCSKKFRQKCNLQQHEESHLFKLKSLARKKQKIQPAQGYVAKEVLNYGKESPEDQEPQQRKRGRPRKYPIVYKQ